MKNCNKVVYFVSIIMESLLCRNENNWLPRISFSYKLKATGKEKVEEENQREIKKKKKKRKSKRWSSGREGRG